MNRIESKTQVAITADVDCTLNEKYSLSFRGKKNESGEITFISNGSILNEYGKTIGSIRFVNINDNKELTVTAPLDIVGLLTPLIVDTLNQVNTGNLTEVESFSRVFKTHKSSVDTQSNEDVNETVEQTQPIYGPGLTENQIKDSMGLPHEPDEVETVYESEETENESEESTGTESFESAESESL